MTKLFRTVAVATLAVAATFAPGAPAQALLAPAQAPPAPAQVLTTGCASVTIIGARGSGQPQVEAGRGALSGFGEQVAAVATEATKGLHAPTTVRYDPLVYPAVVANPTSIATLAYAQSVNAGAAALKVRVGDFARLCPSTKIVLIGFSQGAHVVHQGAAGLAAGTAGHISAVALLADPRRNMVIDDSSWINFTWSLQGQIVADRAAAPFNGAAGPGPRFAAPLAMGRVASFCHAGDWVCNSAPSNVGLPFHTTWYQQPAAAEFAGSWVAGRLIGDGAA
jgi:Cutinase